MTRFYSLYAMLHGFHHADPKTWLMYRCNAALTTAAEGISRGWRVVGITRAALDKFAEYNDRRSPHGRVHRWPFLRPRFMDCNAGAHGPATPFGEAEFLDICETTGTAPAPRAKTTP